MRTIEHGRVRLALRELHSGPGPALLALHSLHGSSAEWGDSLASWRGSVHAIDLSGHGASAWLRGAAYYPELLAGDADVAAAATGARFLVGRGLGAYLALLLAGSRPAGIDAALLLPGRGLEGGGDEPRFEGSAERFGVLLERSEQTEVRGSDPALCFVEADVRPADYATGFAARARRLLVAEDGGPRPPWWTALRDLPSVERVATALPSALERLASSR
jgi:pimeloyl-ACP methyl ester carboxylesterase